MKKVILYFFVACLIVSCNPQKSNTTSWSKDFTTKFISSCVKSASGGSLTNAQAQSYCECMADKVSKKYPNENDADKFTKEDAENLKGGCLPNQANNPNNPNNPNPNNPNPNNPNPNNPNPNNPNPNNPNPNNPNPNNPIMPNNPNQKQWSNDDQGTFLQTCVTLAVKRMDGGAATQLCDCMMQKLMQKYPSRAAANNAYTQEYNDELERECMGNGKGKE